MENRNSYFKPLIENDELYIEIIPAMEGGKTLDPKELISYLTKNGYHDYSLKEIGRAHV